MVEYTLLTLIAIGCFGMTMYCISLLSGNQESTDDQKPDEPHLYEGKTPQYDVEVEPGTYHYDPVTGKTDVPIDEFDLYMLYTIDNLPRGQKLKLNPTDQALTDKLKSPAGHWDQFPPAVQHLPMVWTIGGHGLVLLRIK
ncbi:hypothetical protein K9P40_09420 [Lentilactobacillus otakiensis]|nr:hypothetical protein [Lentilactobacillus otakiensis]MBZ3777293.1 hypothetical protein [Lentilactobacillus otakiensis]MDV3518552.1 hypothetical protein [Lentilactobacillus otakiensis]